jgi:hypothetical protein
MGKVVLKDCYIVVNGSNLSDHVSSVTLTLSKKQVETTNFSGGGTEYTAGLKGDTVEITFQSDYAAASVDDVLYPLYDNENEFQLEVRPTSSAVSTSNPSYIATCLLLEYAPLDGKVGDLASTKIKFPTQRTGFARATS